MNVSRQEEIISALWAICAIMCFSYGFYIWAWIFTVKALLDTFCSFRAAVNEISEGKRETYLSGDW